MNKSEIPQTLEELYSHPKFQTFGSTSDDWINDPDRMERCNDAAEHGCEGSTHHEVMQDWRAFLSDLFQDYRRGNDEDEITDAELYAIEESISAEIDACEAHHEAAGTLHEEIG
jgi:hypothetical protein